LIFLAFVIAGDGDFEFSKEQRGLARIGALSPRFTHSPPDVAILRPGHNQMLTAVLG